MFYKILIILLILSIFNANASEIKVKNVSKIKIEILISYYTKEKDKDWKGVNDNEEVTISRSDDNAYSLCSRVYEYDVPKCFLIKNSSSVQINFIQNTVTYSDGQPNNGASFYYYQ
ncbi:hypothetical protein ACTFIW_003353 [Dictyostelium discoideum]